jgi:potassium inwardly-rectifying channel subfamily J
MELELDGVIPGSYVKQQRITKVGKRKSMSRNFEKRRLVSKKGNIQIIVDNVPERNQLFLADHFTTLIEARWRYVFLIFSFAFIVSWVGFASIWWGIYSYRKKYHKIECIEKVDSWTSAFLFSLETQTTIGYGGRQVTPHCPEGVILLILQCIIGLLISTIMLGLIFAKLSRPHLRRRTVKFSNHGVIALRDDNLCLMFRVGDVRQTPLLEPHIRAVLIRRHFTKEGEEIGFFQQSLPLQHDRITDEKLNLFIPAIIYHEIDDGSPFYTYSPEDILRLDIEIVLILEGILESTGMTTQARTSYLSDEIHWGHLFEDVVSRDSFKDGRYRVNFGRFHDIYPVPTPRCSAKDLLEEGSERDSVPPNSPLSNSTHSTADHEFDELLEEKPPSSASLAALHRNSSQLVPNGGTGFDLSVITKL